MRVKCLVWLAIPKECYSHAQEPSKRVRSSSESEKGVKMGAVEFRNTLALNCTGKTFYSKQTYFIYCHLFYLKKKKKKKFQYIKIRNQLVSRHNEL